MSTSPMAGMAFALLAAVGWGAGAIFVRLSLQYMPPSVGTLISLATGFLLVSAVALALDYHAFLTLTVASLGWFLLLGFINYLMGRFLSYNGIQLVGVVRAAPVQAAAPVFAALWAISLGGERPDAMTLVGGLAIVAGVGLVVSEKWGRE